MTKHLLLYILSFFFCLFSSSFTQNYWIKYNDPSTISLLYLNSDPVFLNGQSGNWDDEGVYTPHVIKDRDTLKMWYTGFTFSPDIDQIGYATSQDGITWERNNGPVLSPGPSGRWDSELVMDPFILRDGDTLKMWYHGTDNPNFDTYRIGYAFSLNGVNWTKRPAPVLNLGPQSWDLRSFWGCSVLYDNNSYHMWYAGKGFSGYTRIGYATSPDGINWTKYQQNPVFSGSGSSWDSVAVYAPHVIKAGDTLKMWYAGRAGQLGRIGNAISLAEIRRIGYAISLDGGLNWIADSLPVLDIGDPGNWDAEAVQYPCVLLDGLISYMWYDGYGGSVWNKIGLATEIPMGIDDLNQTSLPKNLSLHQNYPNPFNPSTTIEFDMPRTSEVSLKVFNILGEKVVTLVSDRLSAGNYSYEWDASNLASGVYLYKLQAGDYIETRKMILMR